ncbi:MAG TPA: class F sortase [Dermatophilaceae bacterium]
MRFSRLAAGVAAAMLVLTGCSSTGTDPGGTEAVSARSVPHLSRSLPVSLSIPAIGVDTSLMKLGLEPDGSMSAPPTAFPAGWYTFSPTPGEIGPSVISGHVDFNGPGVFLRLHQLKAGDKITVVRADGSKPVFTVTRLLQVPKAKFPSNEVYGKIAYAGLRLITCGGAFDASTGHYVDNLIVFTTLNG